MWGSDCSTILGQAEFVLNRQSMARGCTNRDKMAEQLNMHGMTTAYTPFAAAKGKGYSFHFRVPVFHLEALTLFSGKSNAVIQSPNRKLKLARIIPVYEEKGLESLTKREAAAVLQAVKTVYALGLDFGVVDLAYSAAGEADVVAVNPCPELDERLADLFAQAIERFDQGWRQEQVRKVPAVLGADPEFLLADEQGRIVHASRYLPKYGTAGSDVLTIRGVQRFPLAELRPEPASEPRQLIRNIRRAMLYAADQIKDHRLIWVAGAMPANGFALGGHLHMSRIWLNSQLLRALDNYVALPLVLAEEARSTRRRPRYGFLGDFRRQKHGGFEYRTLPSWLVSPKITKGVVALTALIAANYRQLIQRPLARLEVQRMYYEGRKEELLPVAQSLWVELERLPDYASLANYLDPFKQTILTMQCWDERKDFRPAWKIPPFLEQVHNPAIHAIIGTEETNLAGGGER
jgi:hypothetical protein